MAVHINYANARSRSRQIDQKVTFLSEFKKFLFSIVFGIDKSASLLTGRPPALSYQYTRFTPPLDLDDDVIIRGGQELENAIQALDSNGWNTEGAYYPTTKCRGHGFLAIVLNEILELSLSDATDHAAERIE